MSENAVAKPTQRVGSLINPLIASILGRNRFGAGIRLVLLGATIIIYWFILVWLADFPGELPTEWQIRLPPLAFIILNTLAPFFHPQVIIHLIPVVIAILAGFFVASLYLTDLFELDSFWIAASYLTASFFGLGYPMVFINKGSLEELEAAQPQNPLLRIGGPGYAVVHLGFAAVFETEEGIPQVYGPPTSELETARPFLKGFERLRGVIDLRDQIGKVDEVRAVTQDGIEVYARDAQMLFRVNSGGKKRSLQTPYPYTEESIRRLTYGQAVRREGQRKWEAALPEIIQQEIRRFVAQHTLEDFLALQPSRQIEDREGLTETEGQSEQRVSMIQIPRRQLTDHFHTPALKQRLVDMGLELAWVGVGTWEVRDDQTLTDTDASGPAKTLAATWRDLQRMRMYTSSDYQSREHDRSLSEQTAQVIQDLIRTWRFGEFPRPYRCYEILSHFHHQLEQMLHLLESESDLAPPPEMGAVAEHIRFLIRSKELGEGEG